MEENNQISSMPPVQNSPPAQNVTSPPVKPKFKLPVLISIIIFLIVIGIASAAYLFLNDSNKQKACTMEAKICPDSSAVGRTGPNCEFSPCPTAPTPTPDLTASWKTYTDSAGRFSLKHPNDWTAVSDGSLEINGIRVSLGPNTTGGPEDTNTKVAISVFVPNRNTVISKAQDLVKVAPDVSAKQEVSSFSFNGITAYKKVSEGASDLIAFDKDGLVYSIMFFHRTNVDNVDPKVFDQILSTFRFD